MRTAVLQDYEVAALGTAALRGWMAGLLLGIATFALIMLSSLAPEGWLATVVALPSLLPGLLVFAIVGGISSLPSAGLFWATLRLTERVSTRLRALPVWLGVGLVSASPLAAVVWNLMCDLYGDSDGNGGDPYSWETLHLPLLVMTCGLVGAFFALRSFQAELAE